MVNHDGIYDVILIEKDNEYLILERNGETLGYMNEDFCKMIKYLEKSGNIASSPNMIKGLKIVVKESKINILGIDNLKFSEY